MLADPYDVLLFDLDGVLFLGSMPIPGAGDVVATLRRAGKRVVFVTNNSSRKPQAVAEHLNRMGIQAEAEEVETSALTTASLLAARGVGSAFVVGEEGIRAALSQVGIEVLDGEPADADAVVVGFDRGVHYAKLRTASVLVAAGATFVATNGDASYPAADGTRWPGAGAILAAIETASGHRAEIVGKPKSPMLLAALERAGGGRALLIGDRLDTDIAGAAELGWDSALVLTGISSREEANEAAWRPTFVLADLSALVDEH
jgi:phosphoglycolate/pyridoxal phosphate phosphatase family enzyme